MKLSKSAMQKYLRDIPFNPKEPGPMKIVAEECDESYCITRSKIMLSEPEPDYKMIIRLLTIAGIKSHGPFKK